MTDYTITTDFGAKDSLPSGNAAKVIKGSEFTTEFTNILTAVNSKVDSAGDTFTGAVTFDAAVTLNADVTFDTNTLFVDVSENKVGIGNVAPATALDVTGVITTDGLTSSAGIDVTGTVTASGLTVDTDTLYVDATNDRVGIGTTSPLKDLNISNTTGSSEIMISTSDTGTGSLEFGDVTSGAVARGFLKYNHSDNSLQLGSAQTEAMRIDSSGNVGIGTSSPSRSLDVQKSTIGDVASFRGSNAARELVITSSTTTSTGDTYTLNANSGNGVIAIATGSTERMRIDSSGNVGIGTTSPTFDNGYSGLHISQTAPSIHLTPTSSGTTASDGYAINVNSSGIVRHINKENQPIEFHTNNTERMRIDSSGNLLVGKTSGNVALAGTIINNTGDAYFTRDGSYPLYLNRLTSDGDIISLRKDNTIVGTIGTRAAFLNIGSGDTGFLFNSGQDRIQPESTTGGARDAAIDLGASGARFKDLYLSGGVKGNNLTFSGNGSSEHARIDSSGNVLVGRTSASAASGDNGIVLSPLGFIYSAKEGTSAQTHIGFINNTDATATTVGTIRTSGSTTSYNTSSDERLKENIQDADDAGSKIDAIQIRQFDWIADGLHQDYGVIAQELVEVAPEAVSEGDTEEDMMGVDYSKLVPMLIKEVQTLRNRVAQLENN